MAFFPSAVTSDPDGNLFVADGGVKLLAEFAPDGTLLGTGATGTITRLEPR